MRLSVLCGGGNHAATALLASMFLGFSAPAYGQVTCEDGLAPPCFNEQYDANDEKKKIDLYPTANETDPVIVFVHGGGWKRGSRDYAEPFYDEFAARGYALAAPTYHLICDPNSPHEDCVSDSTVEI